MEHISKFHFYSAGIVASNKLLSSKEVEVTPTEKAPMLDGQITDNTTTITASATDSSGAAYQTEIETTVTVTATWLPTSNTNRRTAPDVRRGELVMLYRFGDTDKFFWVDLDADCKFRKLETVIYGWSGTQDESVANDSSNMYFFEVSTHQGLVHFHTSNANEEPYVYDLQINTKTGFIQIQDDIGNIFCLDSTQNQLQMINADGSFLNILGNNITLNAVDNYTITADSMNVNITTSYDLKAKTMDEECSSSIKISSPATDVS